MTYGRGVYPCKERISAYRVTIEGELTRSDPCSLITLQIIAQYVVLHLNHKRRPGDDTSLSYQRSLVSFSFAPSVDSAKAWSGQYCRKSVPRSKKCVGTSLKVHAVCSRPTPSLAVFCATPSCRFTRSAVAPQNDLIRN